MGKQLSGKKHPKPRKQTEEDYREQMTNMCDPGFEIHISPDARENQPVSVEHEIEAIVPE